MACVISEIEFEFISGLVIRWQRAERRQEK